ncbi:MAG: glycosyltransferase [Methylococcaceae bacterium]|nr:glycosyltransferase [Methylococcaceae bacterium]
MKFLLIAYYFPPLPGPGSLRPARLAKHLRNGEHDIFILTQGGSDPGGEEATVLRVHDISFNCHRSGWRRIQWLKLRLTVEALNRAGIYASIFSLWKQCVLKQEKAIMSKACPQAIIVSYPPVETLEIGLHLSRKYQLPLVADFRDGLLFEPIESKRLRQFACVRKAYAKIERQTAASAAALVAVSEPLSDYFRRTYGHERVITVANGFDPEENVMTLPEVTLESGCFHIVHTGRFALSDAGCDIAPLVRAFHELLAARPELSRTLRLHLLGKLSRREKRLLAGLARRGVVRMHGTVGRPQALAFQRRADLLLLVTSPNRSSVATAKIFEYLQARQPVLALTGRTFAAEIVERTRCGWVVSPQSTADIRASLERLLADPSYLQEADLSPEAIREYSFSANMERLDAVLRSIQDRAAATPAP